MKFKQIVQLGKRCCLSTILVLIIPATIVKAQVTPDGSLPTTVEQLLEIMKIEGGEREGNNLFHSFEEFSIPEGMEAVFENAMDIENIFTRVTGESISELNGILRTQGGANFFLVNPNGIVFGDNAQLDVGGSFIATTANSVQFEDGADFSANDAEEQPILTVSVPIGLQFEGNSGALVVNGNGSQTRISAIPPSPVAVVDEIGLSITSGKMLALIGNNVDINGGIITAENGKIEVSSIGEGDVNFRLTKKGLDFDYNNAQNFQNITLGSQALFSSRGDSTISLTGDNIELTDGSLILLQNTDFDSSGNITINAIESLVVKGTTSDRFASFSSLRTETLGEGNAANINISAKNFLLEDQGSISALTFGKGESGNIDVNIANSFKIKGVFQAPISSSVLTATYADGNSGNVRVLTNDLTATDGSVISSSSFGTGMGGNVWVTANEIELFGIGSNVIPTGIITNSLNTGKSGNVTIDTRELRLNQGATVNSTSLSGSGAGNVTINASDSININGQKQNFFSTISSSIVTVNEDIQNIFIIPKISSGNSGNVTINTPLLNIAQSGSVSVRNERTGDAGTIFINTEEINLGNTGNVIANSASGTGGNINLETDQLQLDENSTIAATAENDGDGGNISINTGSLIAKQNSQVAANAFQGRGGNLNINAQGLFLFDSPENIFSASSELGIDGTITINTPDINLQKELEPSKLEFITANEAIANSCLARKNQKGSFTVNRHDSFPRNPNSSYSDTSYSLTGIDSLTTTTKQPTQIQLKNSPSHQSIVPAEKMVETEDGRIFLVASPRKAESFFCQGAEEK